MTKPQMRSRLLFAGKLALGLGLLAWLLLWDDNWIKVLDLFVAVRPIYLIPFIAISFVLIGISCLKWRLFLRDQNSSITFYRLFGLYLIGFFSTISCRATLAAMSLARTISASRSCPTPGRSRPCSSSG